MFQKIKIFILSHKVISIVIILLLVGGSYFLIKKSSSGEVSYVTEPVKIGNITTSVTGTGQVEATNTLTLKAGSSNDVTYVGVKVGDVVKKGKLIASVECTDAKIALENAKISLAKLVDDPDSLTLLQKENSLNQSYHSAWNEISSFIAKGNSMVLDMSDIFNNNGYLGSPNQSRLSTLGKDKLSKAEDARYEAEKSLREIDKVYKTLSSESSPEEILNLLNKAYESSKILASATKTIGEAFEYTVNYLDYEDDSATSTTRTDVNSWIDDSNSYVTDLLSSINSVTENKETLKDLLAGEDELDIRSAQLSVSSKQKAYNDCFVYAPFDGVIGTLTAKVGESAGSSVGTLITKENVAVVSFNEVDMASIKVGQKANLTFDAIEGLKITGEVIEIDSLGTVSSGVVTYGVKISFNENDARVKPGMSVNVEIITDSKENILTAPSSAVKTRNGASYAEILGENSTVIRKPVKIGISDDTLTEIVSGLQEGEKIITKTVNGKSSSTSLPQGTNNNIRINGGVPMGGTAIKGVRIGG
ncbi:MAG TPA: efflux RND transporter periplasmic adaptor subunit [Candidatus Paceibacterota bacterium]|nr:efflux RND transporter periplasmic adaptor subunit [Candidatus Paceibacterota bacterium]